MRKVVKRIFSYRSVKCAVTEFSPHHIFVQPSAVSCISTHQCVNKY